MTELTAADLEPGDLIHDNDGHEGRWSQIMVTRTPSDWMASFSLGPSPNPGAGIIKVKRFNLTADELNERLEDGRYEPIDCAATKTLNADALPVDPDDDVYVRFGDIPDDERSWNSTDGCYEDGVSVYDAEVESVPPESDAAGMFVPVGPKTLQILMLAHRNTYLVTGDRVGMGVDGEPVLRNVGIIAELERGDEASGWVIVESEEGE
jgi:hypothetical protein